MRGFFYKDRKTLYMILGIVLLSVFSLTIVYAALSVTLNITGNAEVVASNWDIHLDNINVKNGSVDGNDPAITNKTTASFSTTLTNPGDFYEFTIDVVNSGTIDAVIDSIEKTTLTEQQSKYLNYIVEYQNGQSISTKQLVEKNSYVRLKVKVEYRKDLTASDLPKTTETLTLSFTVKYVQSDNSSNNTVVENNGKLISKDGDINDIGTIVTIGTEQFYTIGTEGENIKLFSMYNLSIGNEVTGFNEETWEYTINQLENPTGMQSSSAIGSISDSEGYPIDFPWKATTAFSSDEQKGTNYNDYNGSIVEEYVNNYKNKLEEKYGIKVEEARLIKYYGELDDQNTFACDRMMTTCKNSLYPWIYSTSYWTMWALDNDSIWVVRNNGAFIFKAYDNNYDIGVRPVIVISKDQIIGNKKIIEFKVDNATYQAEEGMTWGEWAESEYDEDDDFGISGNNIGTVRMDEYNFIETVLDKPDCDETGEICGLGTPIHKDEIIEAGRTYYGG